MRRRMQFWLNCRESTRNCLSDTTVAFLRSDRKCCIYSPGSVGVNKLIQDGAHLVTNVQDILMALNLFIVPQQVEMQAALPDNSEERTLLALLSHGLLHIDEII